MTRRLLSLITFVCIAATPANAQKTKIQQPVSDVAYADLADLADAASIVAEVKVKRAQKIKVKGQIAGQPTRFLIDADVLALIRGREGLSPRIRYVTQSIPDVRGKFPKMDKAVMLIFAVSVTDRPAEVQLVAPDAQLWWNEKMGADIRQVLRGLVAPGAPGRIKGIASAFHSPGALSGEGETQIFVDTHDGAPMSLMVTRQQGQPPRWTAAYGDVVNPDAPPPAPNTIGWYRLACFLPDNFPADLLTDIAQDQTAAVQRDYAFARQSLGPCKRLRTKG